MRASFINLGQQEMPMPQFTAPRPLLCKQPKPRNPFVAHGQFRLAGKHQAANARQTAKTALKSELRDLWRPPSSTD
jgi:hypothetical protein